MSWKERMEEWGGEAISFLSEDGEVITFVVAGLPRLIKGKFKGKDTERIGCPVVTAEGFTLLIVGKRLARRLSKYEDRFNDDAFWIVRRGAADDIGTKYELHVCDDKAMTKNLFDIMDSDFEESMIDDALTYAESISKN